MSSAGFRALLSAQRNCKRYNRGEVVLASVPDRIHEALELAGFTELFKTFPNRLKQSAVFNHFSLKINYWNGGALVKPRRLLIANVRNKVPCQF